MISIVSNNMIRFNIKSIANYLLFPKNEVHYIGGAEILPAPLSSEEETLLLTHLDDDVLEARQTLIEHNLRLVVYIAKKFDNTGVGVEDLISIGTIGLIKAINTFKSDKNIKLATYASRCIENEILMHLRRNSRIKTEVSIDEPLNVDWDGNELLLSDILGTEEDLVYKDIEDEVDLNLLEQAMDILSDRERTIIELRYTIDTDASYGDSLLTLSTCAYHTDNGRFVVVAKKLTP